MKAGKMKIGILGTGVVGNAIGTKLVQLGNEVKMGSRTSGNEKAAAWVNAAGKGASAGTFQDAAAFGTIVFNCTSGLASVGALKLAGTENLKGKILADVANPLDFSKGMPPTLDPCNTDSLGEQIQREFPDVMVVKTLNTMNCNIMVNPALVPGDHDVFICGNDAPAKEEIKKILGSFGWKTGNIIDMGDISNARGTEQLLPIWIRLYSTFKSSNFNFRIVR
jgi:predicted dinucleotide-binding enzyme